MQKMIKTSGVLLGMVFLAGCGQTSTSQTQPNMQSPVVQEQAQPASNPVAQKPAPVEAQPVADTIGLQTYKNEKFGFTLNYPKNFKFAEDDSGKINEKSNGTVFEVAFRDENSDAVDDGNAVNVMISKGVSADELLVAPDIMTGEKVSKMDAVVGGQKAIVYGYNRFTAYSFSKNGYNYIITIDKGLQSILEEIISSFKFTK